MNFFSVSENVQETNQNIESFNNDDDKYEVMSNSNGE